MCAMKETMIAHNATHTKLHMRSYTYTASPPAHVYGGLIFLLVQEFFSNPASSVQSSLAQQSLLGVAQTKSSPRPCLACSENGLFAEEATALSSALTALTNLRSINIR